MGRNMAVLQIGGNGAALRDGLAVSIIASISEGAGPNLFSAKLPEHIPARWCPILTVPGCLKD